MKLTELLGESGGVGLVIPSVNMPAGMHRDEIRRQAIKFGNAVDANGRPPIVQTDGRDAIGEDDFDEAWSKKYKKSINCSHPAGFSQRAHCAGRRKRQAGGKTKSRSIQESRMDAIVILLFDLFESHGISEIDTVSHIDNMLDENLRKWFRQKWVRFGPDGKIRGSCARGKNSEGKPKCLPQSKAYALGKKGRATAARRKRAEDPNPERKGKAKNVATKEADLGEGYGRYWCSTDKRWKERQGPKQSRHHNEGVEPISDHTSITVDEACWKGYHKDGMKTMFGKRYPNCIKNETVSTGKVRLYTDPNYFGAEIDDDGFDSLPVFKIPTDRLVGFEPDAKMDQPDSQANVKKIVAGLKQGSELPPLLVRKYKNGYQVLDGHHRFWAYKLLGAKYIPSRIVSDNDIEEIGKQDVEEQQCPECGGAMYPDIMIAEKKDACYYKVKSRYKVWPSAYASGALVQCRKRGAKNWGKSRD